MRIRPLVLAVLIFILTLFGLLALFELFSHGVNANENHARIESPQILRRIAEQSPHAVLNYSLIPGGVSTLQDFRMAVGANSILRERFANFNWNAAQITKTQNDMMVFVSFVRNGKLYWTRKTMLIPAGTAIITDGMRTVLMRCGNEIAWTPQTPTDDIDTSLLETPEVPSFDIPMLGPNTTELVPPIGETFTPTVEETNTPAVSGVPCCFLAVIVPSISPSPTPESATFWLMLIGICFGMFVKFKGWRLN